MADQTNAEVSDERLPVDTAETILTLLGIGYQPSREPGADRRRDGVVALLTRRSVTSQASEGAGEPPAVAPAVADELFNRPIYGSPSKRVERLETAPIDTFRESRCEYCGDLNWQASEGCRVSSGHSWLLTDRTLAVYLALQGRRS